MPANWMDHAIASVAPRMAALRSKGRLEGLSPAAEQELIEKAAEPAFVETVEYSEYSDRVIGITVYAKPEIQITGSGTTWLPEAFTGAAAQRIEAMPPDQVEQLIGEVERAMAVGAPTVDVGGAEIPATQTTRVALEQRLETLKGRGEADPVLGPWERLPGSLASTVRNAEV